LCWVGRKREIRNGKEEKVLGGGASGGGRIIPHCTSKNLQSSRTKNRMERKKTACTHQFDERDVRVCVLVVVGGVFGGAHRLVDLVRAGGGVVGGIVPHVHLRGAAESRAESILVHALSRGKRKKGRCVRR
jgi:hypothetical protein